MARIKVSGGRVTSPLVAAFTARGFRGSEETCQGPGLS